jgi:hypothetical protein
MKNRIATLIRVLVVLIAAALLPTVPVGATAMDLCNNFACSQNSDCLSGTCYDMIGLCACVPNNATCCQDDDCCSEDATCLKFFPSDQTGTCTAIQ